MSLGMYKWLVNMKKIAPISWLLAVFIVPRFLLLLLLLILIITVNLCLVRRWFHASRRVRIIFQHYKPLNAKHAHIIYYNIIYKFVCVENHNLANTTITLAWLVQNVFVCVCALWTGCNIAICHLIIMLYNKIITSICVRLHIDRLCEQVRELFRRHNH